MEVLIKLPRLHQAQQTVIDAARRFNVVVCGRRWGKTLLGIDRALWGLLAKVPLPVGWFAPSYKYLLEPWRELVRITAPLTLRVNQQERRIETHGGGSIECWSLDDRDAGRSRAYGRVIVDEAAMVVDLREAWQAAIRPTLADLRGDAWFYSTPKGFDDFHALYEQGQDSTQPEWASWQMPTSTNPYIAATELAAARAMMDPRYYAQEFDASFEDMAGRVYFKFDRRLNVSEVDDTGGTLLIGMDFNVAPMSACVAVRAGDELHVVDEIELTNSNTQEMAQAIHARYPNRRLVIYPDPTANSRKTSAPVGATDFSILKAHGFALRAPTAPTPVVDRVNEVNALCCNAEERRRLQVHPRCKQVIRSLMQLAYKDGVSLIDKTSGLDHMADALGYLVHMEFPLVNPHRITLRDGPWD